MKQQSVFRIWAPAALVLGLSACGGDEPAKQQGGQAQGEILPGSVSDAMIAVDQVKSQAPLAPKSDGGGKSGSGSEESKKPNEE